jgi:hypothetical protein
VAASLEEEPAADGLSPAGFLFVKSRGAVLAARDIATADGAFGRLTVEPS